MIGGSYMGGIAEHEKSEHGGFFILRWRSYQSLTSGDLGRGSSLNSVRFLTEEGRAYFIQAESLREELSAALNDLEYANRQLREIKEKREKRRQARLKRLNK